MNEATSRRTCLQTLFATLFGFLTLRSSPSLAASAVNLPHGNPNPARKTEVPRTTTFEYDQYGRVTKITYGADEATVSDNTYD
jgi:YD repeat-containing protein